MLKRHTIEGLVKKFYFKPTPQGGRHHCEFNLEIETAKGEVFHTKADMISTKSKPKISSRILDAQINRRFLRLEAEYRESDIYGPVPYLHIIHLYQN